MARISKQGWMSERGSRFKADTPWTVIVGDRKGRATTRKRERLGHQQKRRVNRGRFGGLRAALLQGPNAPRASRDRSLPGKARIRARKAANRGQSG